MNATSRPLPAASGGAPDSAAEIDASCRLPLFVLFVSAAAWLIAASVFGLIASIKFHSPGFLADCPWLTYGRVRPAATNALLYGFALPAGLGVALWIIARLGGTRAAQPLMIAVGAKLWNLGVLVGVLGIFFGAGTGHEQLEMPRGAAVILFIGYLTVALWILLTLHRRCERPLRPAQWFLLAALLWFPWIFSTAEGLLNFWPVRGVTQAVIAWWFAGNLNLVCLGFAGLGAVFYFLPKLMNRPLQSDHLALFAFWILALFGSWSGIPSGAPLPAWMPALSAIATVLTAVAVLTVIIIVRKTVGHGCSEVENPPPGKFFAFGVMAFVVSWLMNAIAALPPVSSITTFTWFTVAQWHLNVYGFFAMTMFGAIYHIVPQVTGVDWPSAKAVRAHFWISAIGILLFTLPLAIGGVMQGLKLNNAGIPFDDLTRSTLMFLRLSSVGELLVLAGNALLALNLAGLTICYCRKHLVPVYVEATAPLKPAEVKP